MTWNTPTVSLQMVKFKYGGSEGYKISNFRNSSKGKKKKSMIRGLQMCAFLWRFMEPSEGMQGNPAPLSLLGQPC